MGLVRFTAVITTSAFPGEFSGNQNWHRGQMTKRIGNPPIGNAPHAGHPGCVA